MSNEPFSQRILGPLRNSLTRLGGAVATNPRPSSKPVDPPGVVGIERPVYSTTPLVNATPPNRLREWSRSMSDPSSHNEMSKWASWWVKGRKAPWPFLRAYQSDYRKQLFYSKLEELYEEDPSTRRLWYAVATAHDLESHVGSVLWPRAKGVSWNPGVLEKILRERKWKKETFSMPKGTISVARSAKEGYFSTKGGASRSAEALLYNLVFSSHMGHTAVILIWIAGNLFHVAWQGNYEFWIQDPVGVIPVAHAIWDPHFGESALGSYTLSGMGYPTTELTSGIYHWAFTVGVRSDADMYSLALLAMAAAAIALAEGGGFLGSATGVGYKRKPTARLKSEIPLPSYVAGGPVRRSVAPPRIMNSFRNLPSAPRQVGRLLEVFETKIPAPSPKPPFELDRPAGGSLGKSVGGSVLPRGYRAWWGGTEEPSLTPPSWAGRDNGENAPRLPSLFQAFSVLDSLGALSLGWAGHLVHVSVPASRGIPVALSRVPHPSGWSPLFDLDWGVYCSDPDGAGHVFGSTVGAGTAILTFLGGFDPQTGSLWITDIAHHHLAIGFVLIVLGRLTAVVTSHWSAFTIEGRPYPGRSEGGLDGAPRIVLTFAVWMRDSMHLQLVVYLSLLGLLASLVAQHMYALPPFVYLGGSEATQAALYVHHQYIAGFLMVGSFSHAAIFLVRDYEPDKWSSKGSVFDFAIRHKESIISHLSWVVLFLGFHTLGIYVHNDVAVAFGNPDAQILPEPVFAQLVQAYSGKDGVFGGSIDSLGSSLLGGSPLEETSGLIDARMYHYYRSGEIHCIYVHCSYVSPTRFPLGWVLAVNDPSNALFLDIGPGDFLVHHAISLGVHTTVLILVKGALDARGSKLMPDKKEFGYSFPCDGPGRGGTCDISAWDAFYLAMFWMLNTESWLDFYWHWRHLCLWEAGGEEEFASGSTFLMGWMVSYLSAGSDLVINGYSPVGEFGIDSTWCWMFLFGHLVWATSFMFLISWRGYWQELIETLVWAHERTPLANAFVWRDSPVALSIVQGRLVGLAHFAVGYVFTYAPFLLCGLG